MKNCSETSLTEEHVKYIISHMMYTGEYQSRAQGIPTQAGMTFPGQSKLFSQESTSIVHPYYSDDNKLKGRWFSTGTFDYHRPDSAPYFSTLWPVGQNPTFEAFDIPRSHAQLNHLKDLTRQPPRANFDPLLEQLLILPRLEPADQLLRVKVRPDRILPKERPRHERRRLLHRIEVINLRLELIPIRVLVVDGRRRPMVNAPHGFDAQRFPLLICQRQIREALVREGDMLESGARTDLGPRSGNRDQCDAVVLVVVCDEAN